MTQNDIPITGPLDGVRICLVFEHDLSHYTRVLREIAALQEAGATVQLLTSHPDAENALPGIAVTIAPLWGSTASLIGPSKRGADGRVRGFARKVVGRIWSKPSPVLRKRCLRKLRSEVDLFWVSDYLSLPTVLEATRHARVKVVYETMDLVPEYLHGGEANRRRLLEGERRDIGRVDGFVTVCDSYAEYYMERYGSILGRRPLVCDNMPDHKVAHPGQTTRPLRFLFFGGLMFDRPVVELIEAMALVRSDVTLTFQGKNHIGDAALERIAELGLENRVIVLDQCPSAEIVETAAAYGVGIVALRGADENERRASTTKLFTYMAAGLAVVGSDLPGIARVVDEHTNGLLVKGMEPAAWAHAIDTMAALPLAEIDAMRRRSLEAAEGYSWDRQKPAFIAEFERALGRC
jgi:glycosyltransferase involved in cell wall biosynthesis